MNICEFIKIAHKDFVNKFPNYLNKDNKESIKAETIVTRGIQVLKNKLSDLQTHHQREWHNDALEI